MQVTLTDAKRGLVLLLALASARVILHALTNHQYGFHRDELATIDDARHLAWGYVAYPPLTPAIARVALELFGPSLPGLRLFAALAQGAAMVLSGLMARELGAGGGPNAARPWRSLSRRSRCSRVRCFSMSGSTICGGSSSPTASSACCARRTPVGGSGSARPSGSAC